jgi:fumarate reductase flavoprotein subunit
MQRIFNSAGVLLLIMLAGCVSARTEKDSPAGDRTEYADILVIGGGGTGLSAAISAYQSGAGRIIVVEKQGVWGGSTALSVCMF